MTQIELGQKIHVFLHFHKSVSAVVKDSRAWRQVRRGREHNLALWKAEKPMVLEPNPLLEKHPAYLAFYFVELGECRAVDSEAVMDVTGNDIALWT